MSEHRLIEQMIKLVRREIELVDATGELSLDFVIGAVDFFKTYADKFHHGKEEGILFKELSGKRLSDDDHKMMLDLISEHAFARKTVHDLENSARSAETLNLPGLLNTLVDLYPKHIQKEDNQFFLPSMKYLTQREQEDMLDRFIEFDNDFTSKRYEKILAAFEEDLDRRISQK
jgi:hemerythrin-like domain-containing protein